MNFDSANVQISAPILFSVLFIPTFIAALDCNIPVEKQCMDSFKSLVQARMSMKNLAANRTALDTMCNVLRSSISCTEGYIKTCNKDEKYYRQLESSRNIVDSICKDYVSKEKLYVATCLEKFQPEFQSKCDRPLRNQVESARQRRLQEQYFSVCKSFHKFKTCTKNLYKKKCGAETEKYIQSVIFQNYEDVKEFKLCVDTPPPALKGFSFRKCSKTEMETFLNHCFEPLSSEIMNFRDDKDGVDREKICRSKDVFKRCVKKLVLDNCNAYNHRLFQKNVMDSVDELTNEYMCHQQTGTASKSQICSSFLLSVLFIQYFFK